ncbi:hypothetical protein ACU5B6_00160 [Moritella viscosa]|uniref:hypothetical protein n=1 Tax=Moritella viscosa TaxID=80854 RepID=UPI00406BE46C
MIFFVLPRVVEILRWRRCVEQTCIIVSGNIFQDIFFVEFGESKATYLNKIQQTHEIHAFIDDKYDNLLDAKNAGVDNCIMIKQPHNKAFRERVTSAHDWYEISYIIQTWHEKTWSVQ